MCGITEEQATPSTGVRYDKADSVILPQAYAENNLPRRPKQIKRVVAAVVASPPTTEAIGRFHSPNVSPNSATPNV